MIVINLFGPPGAGKSTAALCLTSLLSLSGRVAEYVPEFAKGQVWAGTASTLRNQLWVLANQEKPLDDLRRNGAVEFAVIDSPLPNSIVYAPPQTHESLKTLAMDLFRGYDNVNVFLQRTHAYQSEGRIHSATESDAIGDRIERLLERAQAPTTRVESGALPGEGLAKAIFLALERDGILTPKGEAGIEHVESIKREMAGKLVGLDGLPVVGRLTPMLAGEHAARREEARAVGVTARPDYPRRRREVVPIAFSAAKPLAGPSARQARIRQREREQAQELARAKPLTLTP